MPVLHLNGVASHVKRPEQGCLLQRTPITHPLSSCVFRANTPAVIGRRSLKSTSLRAVVIDDDDLLQHPDRLKWYESKFCADDMPDWNAGRFIRSEDVAPGLRNVVLECEIGRERVPLRNAYKAVGQRASVRVNNGVEYHLSVASAPFSHDPNKYTFFKTRGDLFAYEIKVVREPISVLGEIHLLVSREEAPEVYDLEADDPVEVGPFRGNGMDLKGSGIMAVFRYPTVIIFAAGRGIANAKALLSSTEDVANLTPKLRKDVRVYYKVPNKLSACYQQELEALKDGMGSCGYAVTVTSATFGEAFDDDQTIMYDPESTAALILTGGDEVEEAGALEACKDAEIKTVLLDSREQDAPIYLSSSPDNFMSWKKQDEVEEEEEEEVQAPTPTKKPTAGRR